MSMHNNMHTTGPPNMTKSHNMGGHGGMTHGSAMNGMQMWFYVSKNVNLMFQGWKVDSTGGLIGSMIGLILMAILYEGIKIGRERLKLMEIGMRKSDTVEMNGIPQGIKNANTRVRSPRSKMCSWLHFIQTLLHMVQVFLGYLLMLAFMTYNVWLCVAIVVGAGTGYFLFGWKRVNLLDLEDHCF